MFERIQMGENVIVLQVSYDDTLLCVRAVNRLYRMVQSLNRQGILSTRRSLDCVAIEYAHISEIEDVLRECEDLDWGQQTDSADHTESLEVPVCHDAEFGRDLPAISRQTGLSEDQIIDLYSSVSYQVWMIGFMPGFPYMGRLPDDLHLQRKSTPDLHIPAGSVAIAEEYVGIYPFDSPGGWHVIGRTPWQIIDYSRSRPFTFDYGMKVRFVPVGRDDFKRLSSEGS